MRSKAITKQSKFIYYMLAPVRILSKARGLYMKGIEDCAGRVSYGVAVGGPAPAQVSRLPRSFSVNSASSASDDEEVRELLRTVSRRNVEKKVVPSAMVGSGGGIYMGRSCSVGLGKIGRIDEERPCFFEEDNVNVKDDLMYPRSRSYAVKRNVGFQY